MVAAFFEGDDDDDDAVLGELLAVADDDVSYVAYAEAVDEDGAGLDALRIDLAAAAGEFEEGAVFADQDVFLFDAEAFCEFCVADEHAVFAVDGDEVFRLDEGEHGLQVFLGAVAGYVDAGGGAGDDVGAEAHQAVDGAADAGLIARDRGGGDDDGVACVDLDLTVGAVGHAGEAGHRFALAAGGQDAEAVVSVVAKFFRFDEGAFRGFEVAEFLGDADDVHHGAAEDADFSFVSDCCVDGHLDAGDVRCEGGKDDAAFGIGVSAHEGLGYDGFGRGVAGILRVRGVGEEAEDASVAELGEFVHVGEFAVDRRVVKFEVAGVYDGADRGAHVDAAGVGNGVADVEESEFEKACFEFVTGFDGVQVVVCDVCFFEFAFDEAAGETCGVDRGVHFAKQVGKGPDVVFVSVGDEDGFDLVFVFDEVGKVRDDDVDPEHVFFWECHACIDYDNFVAVTEYSHVLPDFSKAS